MLLFFFYFCSDLGKAYLNRSKNKKKQQERRHRKNELPFARRVGVLLESLLGSRETRFGARDYVISVRDWQPDIPKQFEWEGAKDHIQLECYESYGGKVQSEKYNHNVKPVKIFSLAPSHSLRNDKLTNSTKLEVFKKIFNNS